MLKTITACMLCTTILVTALALFGCTTDNWNCACVRTCDGQVRAGYWDVCTDSDDLTYSLAYARNVCEARLSQECTTYSCACNCYEDWYDCID